MTSQNEQINRGRAFIKAASSTMITKFILAGLKLAISVMTARFLGAAGRGQFFATIQISGLGATIGAASVGEGLVYEIGKQKIKSEQVFASVLLLFCLFSLITLAAFFALLPILKVSILNELPSELASLIFLFIPAMILEYISSSALKGLKDFTLVNWVSIATRLSPIACLAISFLIWGVSIDVALTSYAAALSLNAFGLIFILFQISGRITKIPAKSVLRSIKYGIAVHVGTVLNEVEYRLDTLILLYFIDFSAVGIYSIGVSFAQFIWYTSNSINTVLFPYLVEDRDDERNKFAAKVIKYSFYLNAIIAMFFIVIGYQLLKMLYGSEFVDAYFVFLILIPGLLMDTLSRTIFSWLKGRGSPIIFSWVSSCTLLLNIILNIYLIPEFGLYGAAMASSVTYSARAVFLILLFSHSSKISIFQTLVFTRSDVRSVSIAVKRIINP